MATCRWLAGRCGRRDGAACAASRGATVAAHVAAECRHDIPAALATFADPNYDVVPMGASIEGADAVAELLGGLFAAFPDFHGEVLSLHHGEHIVFVDSRITGTHEGEWAGVPGSGRPVDFRCGCVFHFEGERLVKETVYFDHLTVMQQIGAVG